MSRDWDAARLEVVRYCRRMQCEHLVHSTAGNLSVRVDRELMAVTPAAFAYDALEPGDVCIVGPDGVVLSGQRRPTTELPLHVALYARRPEVGAVVHTHSPAATTLAVLGWRLPPILAGLVRAVGGDVQSTPFALPGTAGLADAAADALTDRGACFLLHHVVLAIGADPGHAFLAAAATEAASRAYLDARLHTTDVPELEPEAVERLARVWAAQWPGQAGYGAAAIEEDAAEARRARSTLPR